MTGRYDAVGPEAEFQPGSRGRVLRNRLSITSVRELERRESAGLLIATQQSIDETRVDQRFTARRDPGECTSAGSGKSMIGRANTGAGTSLTERLCFTAATQVPRLMRDFERGPLRNIRHAVRTTIGNRTLKSGGNLVVCPGFSGPFSEKSTVGNSAGNSVFVIQQCRN
jgi:hypothetical protein